MKVIVVRVAFIASCLVLLCVAVNHSAANPGNPGPVPNCSGSRPGNNGPCLAEGTYIVCESFLEAQGCVGKHGTHNISRFNLGCRTTVISDHCQPQRERCAQKFNCVDNPNWSLGPCMPGSILTDSNGQPIVVYATNHVTASCVLPGS